MKENFFLRYFWWMNLIAFIAALLFKKERPFEPDYPENRCTRFWGFILAPVIWAIALICLFAWLMLMAFAITILSLFVLIIFPFGFAIVWPWHEEKYIHYKKNEPSVHPYRRYGLKDEKKFPAPWWFWLPPLLIWQLVIKEHSPLKSFLHHIFNFIITALSHPVTWICFGVIIIILLAIRYRKFLFEKIKEIKKKTCLPIVVIKKQK